MNSLSREMSVFGVCDGGNGADMRAIRATISAVAAGAALALAVTGCTGSTTTIIERQGATGSQSAGGTVPGSTGPVGTADGKLAHVTVTTAGDPVTGTFAADRSSWHSTWALNTGQSYTVTVIAVGSTGVR